jgi:hypothetical protein
MNFFRFISALLFATISIAALSEDDCAKVLEALIEIDQPGFLLSNF